MFTMNNSQLIIEKLDRISEDIKDMKKDIKDIKKEQSDFKAVDAGILSDLTWMKILFTVASSIMVGLLITLVTLAFRIIGNL